MSAGNFFDAFKADMPNCVHDLASDVMKLVLTNVAPVATDSTLSDLTQIASGNGYTTDGQVLDNQTSTQTSGTYTMGVDNEVFTASGGTMATWRYVAMYNSTSATDALVMWWDKGTTMILADGESSTVSFTTSAAFTMT